MLKQTQGGDFNFNFINAPFSYLPCTRERKETNKSHRLVRLYVIGLIVRPDTDTDYIPKQATKVYTTMRNMLRLSEARDPASPLEIRTHRNKNTTRTKYKISSSRANSSICLQQSRSRAVRIGKTGIALGWIIRVDDPVFPTVPKDPIYVSQRHNLRQ